MKEEEEVETIKQDLENFDKVEEKEELDELETAEEAEEITEATDEYEYEYIRQTKPIGKLITLVAFTAIMLVSSTYAWFSSQKNVKIGGLKGTVNVADGLEISLDAKYWSQEVQLGNYTSEELKRLYGADGATLQDNNLAVTDPEHNIVPTELLPVSTTGKTNDGIGQLDMNMYRGNNTNSDDLDTIIKVIQNTTGTSAYSGALVQAKDHDYPGYFAIDLFLKNTTGTITGEDILQLNSNSMLQLQSSSANTTGLQNTVRVAFALYNMSESTYTIGANQTINDILPTLEKTAYMTASQEQILKAYKDQTIADVAIWEPNASDHVQYIVNNNNRISWTSTDKGLYTIGSDDKFTISQIIPTYALSSGSVGQTLTNIYDWATPATGLVKQIALQTEKTSESDFKIAGGVKNLVSVNSTGAAIYKTGESTETGVDNFAIPKGKVAKVRMYVWLEGQDVDCINYASHGGGIYLDVGLMKGAEVGATTSVELPSTEETTPYLPATFSYDGITTLANGLTIEDQSGNQYVWVEVPRNSTVYDEIGIDLDLDSLTGDALTTAYSDIETELKEYAADYRDPNNYSDTWSSEEATGIASADDYNALKQTMLKSVYENGGFYIGKYETGTATSRTASTDALTPAVVQENVYPYDYVTNAQAQGLASGMASGEYTSSLMFGIQWDLVLRYLQSKGATQEELKGTTTGSTNWGNYSNSTYNITNTSAKYYTNSDGWKNGAYGEKASGTGVLLSTGADSQFSKQGIYDLAGNVCEYVLETYTPNPNYPCSSRGGIWSYGTSMNACARDEMAGQTVWSNRGYGFRVTIY